jgi:hypothetical protein
VGRRKVTERKIDNTHLLESGKASHKSDDKLAGKGIESNGKTAEKAREGEK